MNTGSTILNELILSDYFVGSAWNELLDHRYETRASLFTSSITAPISGILYFIIFLVSLSLSPLKD